MPYSIKELFYTLQGEGAHAGRPAVFCRFAGCNLWSGREADRAGAVCRFCDTDFVGTDGTGGGKFPGAEEFIKQLASMKFDTIRGPVTIDEMRNPVQNIYIKKVEKKKMFGYDKDELWNTVIKTYPNVNQFGQFKKDEFLATPVYSRDYPPCKFCN